MTTQTQTTTPLAELMADLADPGGDYELSAWVRFNFTPSDGREPWTQPSGDYVLACGRKDGRWRMLVCEDIGEEPDGFPIIGEPILDLKGQEAGADPLALLRALLSGGTA